MSGRITLVRHGPSAFTAQGWIDRAGIAEWRAEYDRAGIQTHSSPPDGVRRLAATATHFVASDLRRAIESADRIAPGRSVTTNPLLREIPLALPNVRGPLPPLCWDALIHLAWSYRIARGRDRNVEHDAQAREAGQWLGQLAEDGSHVFAVTHGVIRRSIAQQLHALGWRAYGGRQRYHPWSAWEFTSPATR